MTIYQMSAIPEPILKCIRDLAPTQKWEKSDADAFRRIYYQHTGKMVDSDNPSYPFSAFYEPDFLGINLTHKIISAFKH